MNDKLVLKSFDIADEKMDTLFRNSIELIRHARKHVSNQINYTQLMA